MSPPSTTDAKLDMVLMIVKSLEKKLDSCRGHCDTNTAKVWEEISVLRAHSAKINGAEEERRATQDKINVQEQKRQSRNMLWSAAIGAATVVVLEVLRNVVPMLVKHV